MTVDRRVSSIESSFKMESMPFDAECRQRVRNVLTKKVSATDAISELNKKYRVSIVDLDGHMMGELADRQSAVLGQILISENKEAFFYDNYNDVLKQLK